MSNNNDLNQLLFKCLTFTDVTKSMELRRAQQRRNPELAASLTVLENSALGMKCLTEGERK